MKRINVVTSALMAALIAGGIVAPLSAAWSADAVASQVEQTLAEGTSPQDPASPETDKKNEKDDEKNPELGIE